MEKISPSVSIIIPTYRRPELLKRAIRSALNQTYKDLQVCVYDNASGDETGQVVAEIASNDPRVRYYCHETNLGLMGNFNYGMAHVDTPYFSFLSDDDVLLPEYIATAMEGFRQYPDAMFSAGSTILATPDKKVMHVPLDAWPREGYYPAPEGLFHMTRGNHPIITAILYKREVVEKFGVMDVKVGMPADLDYELKVAAHFPVVISKKPCAIFILHQSSTGTASDYRYFWPSWTNMINNLTSDDRLSADVRLRAGHDLDEMLKKRLLYLGYRSILRKDFQQSREVSVILKDRYAMRARPWMIRCLSTICERLPIVYALITPVNKARRVLRSGRSGNVNEEYTTYLSYMDA